MKTCKKCGEIIKGRQFVNGKYRNFQRRKYCLKCSPFGSGNTRKLEAPIKFDVCCRKKRDTEKYLKWQKKARKERKNKLVEAFGSCCSFCKYDRCHKALEFHYVDPSEKNITISTLGILTKWVKIIKEIKKCIMVCSNCHREIHSGMISQKQVKNIYQENFIEVMRKLDEEVQRWTNKSKNKKNYYCVDCNKIIDKRAKRCAFCYNLNRKKNRPPKEQLLKEIKETNYCAVGRKYGVSDNAIRKWLK
ncbi:hypothetical protein GOV14_00755 [Candidatus Pacearchaeota archaeon]|nr:hypothetical protein [Candidatus Pacearchaeota archaeon]